MVAWIRRGQRQEGHVLEAEPTGAFWEPRTGQGLGERLYPGPPWVVPWKHGQRAGRRSQGSPEGLPLPRPLLTHPGRAPCPVGLSHII